MLKYIKRKGVHISKGQQLSTLNQFKCKYFFFLWLLSYYSLKPIFNICRFECTYAICWKNKIGLSF